MIERRGSGRGASPLRANREWGSFGKDLSLPRILAGITLDRFPIRSEWAGVAKW